MLWIMISTLLALSIMFTFMNHPLSMGVILLFQTIIICLISGSMAPSFWFSYILLLIYLGGMLVLFMYVTSIASNELFLYSNKNLLIFFIFPFMLMMLNIINILVPMNLYENLENYLPMSSWPNIYLLKMYNHPINIITIMIASYLFLVLIAVVKIISIYKGPIRQFN
uniref:NADH-ubiquinone oxidoreductase chain 6 n=1 Tax=Theopompa sp. FY-2016a TaxID=1849000 RepID=A0A172QHH8_9NEOP|nr:NADH dehydrogenase subunit 6 [Theopompa sp. FY-2016a]ASY98324.1 NADH dehydrogenase subunit 6 [Theopompa milligratulata]